MTSVVYCSDPKFGSSITSVICWLCRNESQELCLWQFIVTRGGSQYLSYPPLPTFINLSVISRITPKHFGVYLLEEKRIFKRNVENRTYRTSRGVEHSIHNDRIRRLVETSSRLPPLFPYCLKTSSLEVDDYFCCWGPFGTSTRPFWVWLSI